MQTGVDAGRQDILVEWCVIPGPYIQLTPAHRSGVRGFSPIHIPFLQLKGMIQLLECIQEPSVH
jgi:hypothetical protein